MINSQGEITIRSNRARIMSEILFANLYIQIRPLMQLVLQADCEKL